MNQASPPKPSAMSQMGKQNAEWWNDSCHPEELRHAIAAGAVGATSNPVIVASAVKDHPDYWNPSIDRLVAENPTAIEEEIAWLLIEEVGRRGADVLRPVYDASNGRNGFLCLQVNPKFHCDPSRMVEHAAHLSALAPNIAIKIPCTTAGLEAIEKVTARGIAVNVTVSFSVAQAVAAAEAIERGLATLEKTGTNSSAIRPYITIMIGRVDDYLKRVALRSPMPEEETLRWGGIAVFKKFAQIAAARGYRGIPLAAAYRHALHWSEIVGPHVIQSIPYTWWNEFADSDFTLRPSLKEPAPTIHLDRLQDTDAFRLVYEEDALKPRDFTRFEPSVHTLTQFLEGYHELLAIVRERMLR